MGKKLFSKMSYPSSFNMMPVMDKAFDSTNHKKGDEVMYDLYGVAIH